MNKITFPIIFLMIVIFGTTGITYITHNKNSENNLKDSIENVTKEKQNNKVWSEEGWGDDGFEDEEEDNKILETNQNITTNNTISINSNKTYTIADISSHSNGQSCWTAVNGNVYDLTSFINKHPGGSQKILSLCGKDGTSAFTSQHGGQSRPANELEGLQIGVLVK